jgi:hypothetical protein
MTDIVKADSMPIQLAVERYNTVVEFTKTVMREGRDYGQIPGTDKPTLLKPGAEKLCSLFGLRPRFELIDKIVDFDNGLFYFQYRCILSHHDEDMAQGIGSCNSRESKYRYRWLRTNKKPQKDEAEAMKAKGVGRWRKINGKWVWFERMENTEPFDLINTIDKMAQKRALIAATLIAVNASEFFTQDIEDMNIIDAEIVGGVIESKVFENTHPESQSRTQPKRTEKTILKELGFDDKSNGDNKIKRPYTPEQLKARIDLIAGKLADKPCSDTQRKILASMLDTTFEGDKTKRYELSKWLFGAASTKEIAPNYILAGLRWLGVNDWNDVPVPEAIQEARNALPVALEAMGQAKLIEE